MLDIRYKIVNLQLFKIRSKYVCTIKRKSSLNLSKITRTKIDHVEDGIRVRFYEGQYQVAKSKRFETVEDANKWLLNY